MTKLENCKDSAPDQFYGCCLAKLREGNESPELFARSWSGKMSPLVWRVPIFVWAVGIITWSVVCFWGPREMFLLYMTHWGLIMIFLESLFGILVCIKKHRGHFKDRSQGLPWYVRAYWVLYNVTVPLAFLISLFYWAVLRGAGANINYAPDPILDVMLHGGNSVLMLIELLMSRHPSRLLHVMQPLYFSGVYLLFTLAHFFAEGHDPWGNAFIYPVIDWSKPIETLIVLTLTALFFALMHILTVGISTVRDYTLQRLSQNKSGVYNDGFEP
ncbi:protein rolling stone-like [Pieris brassicae]|nr:protein rolling stone-like [Pieris brassicae]XP_045527648.1 protein rolling stone-like [Pieris brassicae]